MPQLLQGYGIPNVVSVTNNTTTVRVSEDAVVGSASQVTAAVATHSTLTAALAAVSDGKKIIVLDGTFSENVTVNKKVKIEGKGANSYINGTLTFTSAGNASYLQGLRFGGNITLPSDSSNIFIRDCWLVSSASISDLGTSNAILLIQE
jgi:fructose-1,6-bisphosphatase